MNEAPVNRLGVLGWPVSHSLSPRMHNAALRELGLLGLWNYQHLPVPEPLFVETVTALADLNFAGVNVTIPHKAAALTAARRSGAQISHRAAAIGAANTLVFSKDGWIDAHNTDAPGLISELGKHGQVRGASAMVLGAGGSARAAVWALLDAGAARVQVWNRTRERAVCLCRELGGEPSEVVSSASILVNCTAVGLAPGDTLASLPLPVGGLAEFGLVADFSYRADGAVLTLAAREAGVPTVDGLELLVAQGAASFELFVGVEAPVTAMRRAVGLSCATQ
ncbi:MAG: shikimate dehydrogenase family protein [Solirubrobacteraceae bacterium]